jgi:hypothetical protein
MDGACSTNGDRVLYSVLWKNMSERDHLEDPDVDGRIILK